MTTHLLECPAHRRWFAIGVAKSLGFVLAFVALGWLLTGCSDADRARLGLPPPVPTAPAFGDADIEIRGWTPVRRWHDPQFRVVCWRSGNGGLACLPEADAAPRSKPSPAEAP